MNYQEELQKKKEDLIKLLPQLIDLKQGYLDVITLKRGETADLLQDVIQDGINKLDADLRAEMSQNAK